MSRGKGFTQPLHAFGDMRQGRGGMPGRPGRCTPPNRSRYGSAISKGFAIGIVACRIQRERRPEPQFARRAFRANPRRQVSGNRQSRTCLPTSCSRAHRHDGGAGMRTPGGSAKPRLSCAPSSPAPSCGQGRSPVPVATAPRNSSGPPSGSRAAGPILRGIRRASCHGRRCGA